MSTDTEHVFSTQVGDTLVDLCKRVYGLHDHGRVCQIAVIVAAYHPDNSSVVKNRVSAPLPVGKQIRFPKFEFVAGRLAAEDALRDQALRAPRPMLRSAVLGAPPPRAVGVISKPAIARTLTKALFEHCGLTPSQAQEKLRPVAQEALAPASAHVADVVSLRSVGTVIGMRLPETSVRELLDGNDVEVTNRVLLLLRTFVPRNFPPQVDASASVDLVIEGITSGLSERLLVACRAEFDRRFVSLSLLFEQVDVSQINDEGQPVSSAFAGVALEPVVAALSAALKGTPPGLLTPRIAAMIEARFFGERAQPSANRVVATLSRIERTPPRPETLFIDAFEQASDDGWLARQLYTRAHPARNWARQALDQAEAKLALVEAALATLTADTSPSALLAQIWGPLSVVYRSQVRALSGSQLQVAQAEERRMLAGRNYVSFRKDIALLIDNRVAPSALTPRRKITVLLALLTSIGHRLAGMSAADIEAEVESLVALASNPQI